MDAKRIFLRNFRELDFRARAAAQRGDSISEEVAIEKMSKTYEFLVSTFGEKEIHSELKSIERKRTVA